jgi:glutathione peroxidase
MVLVMAETPNNIDLTAIDGRTIRATEMEGKTILFVNVASKCGFTSQYDGLQKLYERYKEKNFVIVGVPCNQFGGQEPGTAEEIQTFCKMNYGVNFPILEKQDVNGANRSELYKNLIDSEVGGGNKVKWNFEKFLVDKDGTVVGRYSSRVGPDSAELDTAIQAAIK